VNYIEIKQVLRLHISEIHWKYFAIISFMEFIILMEFSPSPSFQWQQSEDSERKRQIRSHLYKLRESRLCNLYRHETDPMSEPNGNGHGNVNTLAGYAGKDPLATSHGDALLDQNFQSLKSKEVRDSTSPTHELRFHSMTLSQPNTTGWDVQTSSEVSPDGRAYRTETLAKTDGK